MRPRFTRADLRLPLLLLLLTALAILSSVVRLIVLATTPVSDVAGFELEDQRYFQNSITTGLHILPGLLFLLIGITQFMPAVRRAAPRVHRWMGRVGLVCGLVSAAMLYWLAFSLPALGGWVTIVGTYVFATLMILALVAAWLAIRRREVPRHRAFMIRAYAIGSAVATIRLLGILGEVILGIDFLANFGLWLWVGMSLHVVVAELISGQSLWVKRRAAPLVAASN
jgi:uncharacterized membrane protein